ncbi:MAG: hypothetical protein ACPK7O_05520 [Methanobacterium sp.]
MDIKGQIAIEFLLLIGFILMLIIGINSYLGEDIELNKAMAAARSGASEGASVDSFAIYPEESFKNSSSNHPSIINPSSVKIVKIDYNR